MLPLYRTLSALFVCMWYQKHLYLQYFMTLSSPFLCITKISQTCHCLNWFLFLMWGYTTKNLIHVCLRGHCHTTVSAATWWSNRPKLLWQNELYVVNMWQIWGSHSSAAEDSSLLGGHATQFGERFKIIPRTTVHPYGQAVHHWRRELYYPSKGWEQLTKQHSRIRQEQNLQ